MAGMLALSFATLFTVTSAHVHARDLLPRAENANFGYSGTRGPLGWHRLSPANEICARGKNQSPIPIDPGAAGITTLGGGSRPTINYPRVPSADYTNLGDTTQVQLQSAGGTLKFNNVDYNLQQFHFHVPSEHRLREEFYPIEVHFVHQKANPSAAGDNILVLGVFFQLTEGGGGAFKLIARVIEAVGNITAAGQTTKVNDLDFSELKTEVENNDSYSYSGSLTTPPCSEGVRWIVLGKPLPMPAQLFNQLKSVIKFNSRYTQNYPGQQNLLEYAAQPLCPA